MAKPTVFYTKSGTIGTKAINRAIKGIADNKVRTKIVNPALRTSFGIARRKASSIVRRNKKMGQPARTANWDKNRANYRSDPVILKTVPKKELPPDISAVAVGPTRGYFHLAIQEGYWATKSYTMPKPTFARKRYPKDNPLVFTGTNAYAGAKIVTRGPVKRAAVKKRPWLRPAFIQTHRKVAQKFTEDVDVKLSAYLKKLAK